jgi:hypothetical protein
MDVVHTWKMSTEVVESDTLIEVTLPKTLEFTSIHAPD